jgi:hypothetical protein
MKDEGAAGVTSYFTSYFILLPSSFSLLTAAVWGYEHGLVGNL